ncbi:MAG: hypothetical protein C4516_08940 [Oxalobacter sp.]|nr:MAG: hypothetical protein C4516_08940 [Oxalobacter sp.]
MNQPTHSSDERRRIHEELLRDPGYSKSRNSLLWASVLCCVGLALMGLMVMSDRLSMDMAIGGITGCVVVYFYFMVRTVKMRNAAEARMTHAQIMKTTKKKESKKNR